MNFHIGKIHDLDEAKMLWNMFSPQININDSWDFRYCFYKYFSYELYFYVGYVDNEPIGLLPLQWNSDEQYLEFFGGYFMGDNRVFIKPGFETYIPNFYTSIGKNAHLSYIAGDDAFSSLLPVIDYKYILPLDTIESVNDYLQKNFQSKARKKINKAIQDIESHRIEILQDKFEDIDLLFQFNTSQFGDDSSFHKAHRTKIFHDLTTLPGAHLLSFCIDEKKQALAFGILYKGIYTALNSGTAIEAPKGMKTFVNVKKIEYAFLQGAHLYDAEAGDCGWKEKWGFQKVPQYKYFSSEDKNV